MWDGECRQNFFHLSILHPALFSPVEKEHHGWAIAALLVLDFLYALNSLCVATTTAVAPDKNRALRSISSLVCWNKQEREPSRTRDTKLAD